MKFDAVILAGGQSRRMGQDKGLMDYPPKPLEYADSVSAHLYIRPMVSWVSASLSGAQQLWVNTNEHENQYHALGFSILKDVFHEDIGPLAGPLLGILTGLKAAKSDWVLFSPCDTPNLPADYSQVMTKFASDHLSYASVVFDGDRRQNLHALLHKSLADDLMMYLLAGGRKTYQWLDRVGARDVDFSAEPEAFANINTQEDMASL